jgi:hypothetical protein
LAPKVKTILKERLGLDFHDGKLKITSIWHGIDFLGAWLKPHRVYVSRNCVGRISKKLDVLDAAGKNVEAVKADTFEAIRLIKKNLPENRWPEQIKRDFEIEWRMEVPSFLEYYSSFMSLAGMEKMTGINQKQLSNYLNRRTTPRKKQSERICEGIHRFAEELLSITL